MTASSTDGVHCESRVHTLERQSPARWRGFCFGHINGLAEQALLLQSTIYEHVPNRGSYEQRPNARIKD